MKIEKIGGLQTVMSNPDSKHNYFGWPTIARLKNGRIAVAASGFRLKHVCPFGKTVLSISEDECKTFSRPMPIIDTPLDDRDGGLMTFGEAGVMITAFNNTADFQRQQVGGASLEVADLNAT
ncbi:MAG: exo-alpha-sialidase, partial [Clostridia bacterium]|nr:exo-alpha-sialidase [Clostridia bacterium]